MKKKPIVCAILFVLPLVRPALSQENIPYNAPHADERLVTSVLSSASAHDYSLNTNASRQLQSDITHELALAPIRDESSYNLAKENASKLAAELVAVHQTSPDESHEINAIDYDNAKAKSCLWPFCKK